MLASSSALNALGGTPFSPGAFSFANFVADFLSLLMIWVDLIQSLPLFS